MALTINTNVSSLFAQQSLGQNEVNFQNTLERLSSGHRINDPSDDPAGLAIAEGMQTTINGLNTGAANALNGVALVQTAAGAMTQILNDLQQMATLATQALNGTNSSTDLSDLDAQYQVLLTQISDTASGASFNGVALLSGGSLSIQTGSSTSNTLSLSLINASTGTSGLSVSGTNVSSNASSAISAINTAINTVTTGLATLGADEAGLNAVIQNNQTYATNLSSAESNIMDTDYALETSNLAKYQILNQTDVAMLAQANSAPQLVLQLLKQ